MAILRPTAFVISFLFAGQSLAGAEDACRTMPTPVCVLDKARAELDDFVTAETPPDSMLWDNGLSDDYERAEAMRIVRDVHGDVAASFARAGQTVKAQEALSAIRDPAEIASRLETVVILGGDRLDPAWLRTTVSAAAEATYPFGKMAGFFDDYQWQALLSLARDHALGGVVTANIRRATSYAASPEFAALPQEERDRVRISLLEAALVAGDVPAAEGWLKAIETADQSELGRMRMGAQFAMVGDTARALAYGEGMNPVRRADILRALVIEAADRADLKSAEKWLSEINDDYARELTIREIAQNGQLFEAQALGRLLQFGQEARILNAVMHEYIDRGELALAALVAERVAEVGERAVSYGALAIAAASANKFDLVVHAEEEILRMRKYKVDAGQIADSEIAIFFAFEILGKTDLAKARFDHVRADIAGVTGDAYPDDPAAALGATEEQVKLLIQFAAVQFAAGIPGEAMDTIIAITGNRPQSQGDLTFITAEAAGIAYGVTGPVLGSGAVSAAIAMIEELSRPIDRAMMFAHLAKSMQLQHRRF